MDFKQMQAMGGIVSQALVPKDIRFTYHPRKPEAEWADPQIPEHEEQAVTETGRIFVRKRSSRDFLDIVKAPEAEQPFLALFRCVCNEDGTPLFPSVEDAGQLAEWLMVPMIAAVNEVNSFVPKPSPLRTSSGTTSPSPSAAGVSRSGRTPSRKRKGRPG